MATKARRVTASDIARSLGLSRATVGFVLNDTPGQTISETTRRRVLAEAERLGYRPHAAARALARGSNRLVLFVLPDWPVSYTLADFLDEAATVLDRAGYALVTWTRHQGDRARPLWEALDPDIVVPVASLTDEERAAFRPGMTPALFPGSEPTMADQSPLASAGTELQVEHLHQLGHTRVAYAGPADPRSAGMAAARLSALQRRGEALGVEVVDEQLVAGADGRLRAVVQRWVTAGVTGVVAFNDEVAAAVVRAAVTAGVAVPEHLAVVGHDDSPLAGLFLPALTSVRVDAAGMGGYTAHAVLHALGVESAAPGLPELDAAVVRRETS